MTAGARLPKGDKSEVAYRALLIGEVNFKGSMYAARNYGDVELLTEMLENVKTPSGSHYSVTRRQDLSRADILYYGSASASALTA